MANYLHTSLKRQDYSEDIYPFVIVAHISAALNQAQDEAKKLSLTAKNARTLAMRAGEQAAGFKVITNYIDEFAQQIIGFASKIQTLSVRISEFAGQVSFTRDFCTRVEQAKISVEEEQIVTQLDEINRTRLNEIAQYESSFLEVTEQLSSLLEDIDTQMRAANFIALTAKVEAVSAPEYVDSLNSVADAISDIAKAIHQSTKHCFNCLASYKE